MQKQCVKDLGVLIDTKLSLKDQLDHVVASSNRVLGLVVNMTREHNNITCTTAFYCSLFRSLMEYANIVWWPTAARPFEPYARFPN